MARKQKKSDKRQRKAEPSIQFDIPVMFAMAIITIAVVVGLYIEVRLGFLLSLISGVAVFLLMAGFHGVARQVVISKALIPRTETVERTLARLAEDVAHIDKSVQKLALSDELFEEVRRLKAQLNGDEMAKAFTMRDQYVDELEEEIARVEKRIVTLGRNLKTEHRDYKKRMNSELQVVKTLVKQLAEQIASENRSITPSLPERSSPTNQPAPPVSNEPLSDKTHLPSNNDKPISSDAEEEAEHASLAEEAGPILAGLDTSRIDSEMLEIVRQSIAAKKIDLYLQPIVTLPQRNVCHYEAFTRLRNVTGELLMPDNYIHVAEQAGIMPLIDNVMLFRSVQVVRRLAERGSGRGLFCNISAHSLLDPEFFPDFVAFIDENKALSDNLFFEFSQDLTQNCSAIEIESLNTLAKLGFRFSLDKVSDLNIDYQSLHDQGFRFIKIDSKILLDDIEKAGGRIHPADMRNYLERYGLQLIVEKIEDERSLAQLMDFNIELGQGFLFSEPRPVRQEVFDGKSLTEAA